MENKLLALLVELNKVVFGFEDFERYNQEMRYALHNEWIVYQEVEMIMWFFENMFFDEVDHAIMCHFEANIKEEKYHKVMVHYDAIMKNVLEIGKKYV